MNGMDGMKKGKEEMKNDEEEGGHGDPPLQGFRQKVCKQNDAVILFGRERRFV